MTEPVATQPACLRCGHQPCMCQPAVQTCAECGCDFAQVDKVLTINLDCTCDCHVSAPGAQTDLPHNEIVSAGGELLPCPFCGSHEQPTVFGLKPDQWWVECSGYEGLCCKLFLSTTKEEAVQRWNTRTRASASSPAASALLSSQVAEKIASHIKGHNSNYYSSWQGLTELEGIISRHFAAIALERCRAFKPSFLGVPSPEDRCTKPAGHEGKHSLVAPSPDWLKDKEIERLTNERNQLAQQGAGGVLGTFRTVEQLDGSVAIFADMPSPTDEEVAQEIVETWYEAEDGYRGHILVPEERESLERRITTALAEARRAQREEDAQLADSWEHENKVNPARWIASAIRQQARRAQGTPATTNARAEYSSALVAARAMLIVCVNRVKELRQEYLAAYKDVNSRDGYILLHKSTAAKEIIAALESLDASALSSTHKCKFIEVAGQSSTECAVCGKAPDYYSTPGDEVDWESSNARRHELIESKTRRALTAAETNELAELQGLAGLKRESLTPRFSPHLLRSALSDELKQRVQADAAALEICDYLGVDQNDSEQVSETIFRHCFTAGIEQGGSNV